MFGNTRIRWGWLRFMYLYTIVGAGAFGLGIVFAPNRMISLFGWPKQDPIMLGIAGSVFIAFAVVSALGLRSPLKFAPILLLQLCYKLIWLIGVIAPPLISGRLPSHAVLPTVVFVTYVVGDLIAVPFSHILEREPHQ